MDKSQNNLYSKTEPKSISIVKVNLLDDAISTKPCDSLSFKES